MGPQKFIAANTTEALKLVRQQVGGDAMVLSTRDTPQGVEIVAISPEALSKLSQRQDDPGEPSAAAKPAFSAMSPAAPGAWAPPAPNAPGFDLEPPSPPKVVPQPMRSSDLQVEQLLAEFSQVKQLLQTHLSARAWEDLQAESSDKAEALRILLNAGFSPQLCAELADDLMALPPAPDERLVDRLQLIPCAAGRASVRAVGPVVPIAKRIKHNGFCRSRASI
jgi:flagellar biosynthesis protein FlhF